MDAAIQVAQERDTVVIALITIGSTGNCQAVYSRLMLKELTTVLWNTSWKSGVRDWERNRNASKDCLVRRHPWMHCDLDVLKKGGEGVVGEFSFKPYARKSGHSKNVWVGVIVKCPKASCCRTASSLVNSKSATPS